MGTMSAFWDGFEKQAAIKIPKGTLPRLPKPVGLPTVTPGLPEGMSSMAQKAQTAAKTVPKIKPATASLDYAEINKIAPKPASGTVTYKGNTVSYSKD